MGFYFNLKASRASRNLSLKSVLRLRYQHTIQYLSTDFNRRNTAKSHFIILTNKMKFTVGYLAWCNEI